MKFPTLLTGLIAVCGCHNHSQVIAPAKTDRLSCYQAAFAEVTRIVPRGNLTLLKSCQNGLPWGEPFNSIFLQDTNDPVYTDLKHAIKTATAYQAFYFKGEQQKGAGITVFVEDPSQRILGVLRGR